MKRRRRDFGVIIADGTPTNPSFSARWRDGGRHRRKSGFPSRTAAAEHLAMVRTAAASGLLDAHRRSDIPLVAVAEEWLRVHSAVRLRSHQDNVERWARLARFLGVQLTLSKLSPTRILELREHLAAQGLKASTVNRHLALLRTVLNHAVTTGYIAISPVARFPRGGYLLPEVKPKIAPPLESNEEAARFMTILRADAPERFALFAFLLLTGSRKGEAAGLRWSPDVDLTRRMVTIRRSYDKPPKSGKERTVPLTMELAEILAEHRLRDPWGGPLVFPNPLTGEMMTGGVKLGPFLEAACKKAGITRMHTHLLRHANASLTLMNGGSLTDVQRNLGHSTPVLTSETYGHLAEDHRIREADRRLTLNIRLREMPTSPGPLSVVKGGEKMPG